MSYFHNYIFTFYPNQPHPAISFPTKPSNPPSIKNQRHSDTQRVQNRVDNNIQRAGNKDEVMWHD